MYLSQRDRAEVCHRQYVEVFKDSTTILKKNEVLHLTVYPVGFPQLFKHTFTEIVFLIVHEGFKVWK